MGAILNKSNGYFQYRLDEFETDQAKEEMDEIMDVNHDSERKFGERDEFESFEWKGNFSNVLPLKNSIKNSQKCTTRQTAPCQKDTSKKKFNMLFVNCQRTIN
ncbi:hypothetical protein TNCV_2993761 [Trichonephila clavipes]|nr:hypothetical protein TNCV_2993761 [Trichonephila clavipes]